MQNPVCCPNQTLAWALSTIVYRLICNSLNRSCTMPSVKQNHWVLILHCSGKYLLYSVWSKKLIEWSCTAAVTTGRFPVGIRMFYCKYLGIVLVGWLMAGTVIDDFIWYCARIFFNLPWRTSLSHPTRHVCMMSHMSLREASVSWQVLLMFIC